MLTARDSVPDRIEGLDIGADDYVVKPFDCGEVLARLKALSRRAQHWQGGARLKVGPLEIDLEARQVSRGGRELVLPPIAFKLLEVLVRASPRVVTQERLASEVWGDEDAVDAHTMRTHLYNLRQVIDAGFDEPLLHTRPRRRLPVVSTSEPIVNRWRRFMSSSWGQVAAFAFIALLALMLTHWIVTDILVREALQREADHYWAGKAADPAFPLPSTANLTGYSTGVQTPEALQSLAPGLHQLVLDGHQTFVHVSEQDGENYC